MENFLAVLCLAGLVASAVVVDRSRQDVQGDDPRISLSRENLHQQKFILDILREVELPSQNQQSSQRNINCAINENILSGSLNGNMRRVLDLIRSNRENSRKNICSMNSEEDLQNLGGLYLLLIRSRDFEALQQIALCARQRLNPVLFVNALILALEDRSDTRNLVIPALHEVLPKLYLDESLVRQVQNLNNQNSDRPNVQDILSLGEQTRQRQDGENVSQLGLPRREIHQQLQVQKSINGKIISQGNLRQDVNILTSSNRWGLLKDDVGLKSFLNLMFIELVLKENVLRVNNNRDSAVNSRNNIQKYQRIPGGKIRNQINRAENNEQEIDDWQDNVARQNVGGIAETNRLNVHRGNDDIIRQQQQYSSPGNGRQDVRRQSGRERTNEIEGVNSRSGVDDILRQHQTYSSSDYARDLRSDTINGLRISSGQRLLSQLQQIIARLNIEDIALGRTENSLNDDENNKIHQLDDLQRRVVLNNINEISDRINGVIQNRLRQLSNNGQTLQRNSRLDEEIDHIILLEILNEVTSLTDYIHDGQISGLLAETTTQQLLRHIVKTIGKQLQQLQNVRNVNDIAFNGVRINNVDIDKLQTYLEYITVDLNNLLPSNLNSRNDDNQRLVVGRIPRLNHRPFAIRLNVNSERNQEVVVRTLLLPQVDVQGNRLSALQQRENAIVLDIARVGLKSGQNLIVRQSRDINWAGRDTTSYTELYQRVLGALRNAQESISDIRVSQNHLFPQRLLVPRGRTDGLQVKLLVVITPAEDINNDIRSIQKRINALVVDSLPLTYPLDRGVNDLNAINQLSNVQLKDILIYHHDKLEDIN